MDVLITTDEIYKYPASSIVLIKCSKCDNDIRLRVNSIRQAIKKHGVFTCKKCILGSDEFKQKQKLAHPKTGSKWNSKVDVVCSICSNSYQINHRSLKWIERNRKSIRCNSCTTRQKHVNGEFKHIYDNGFFEELKEHGGHFWELVGDDWKSKYMAPLLNDPEYIKLMSECGKKPWNDVNYKAKMADVCKKMWQDPIFLAKMRAIWQSDEYKSKSASGRKSVSELQKIVYSILDDLGVGYYRERDYWVGLSDLECKIGPWSFDCVIPREGKKTLLLEINGEWTHSRPKQILRDQQKASYIGNNLFEKYELKYLWEHEFLNKDRLVETIKYWLGITNTDIVDFEFADIDVRDKCPASEYRILLGKYHYLANAGRGGLVYGAYYDDELVAVCIFSPLVRQNLDKSLKCEASKTRELSRLCINPKYQKKNFASWFISKCINQLPKEYDTIVSYADTTFNHNGTIYKACGFTQDHISAPDYWYVAPDGWVIHKKKLYNQAVKLGMVESDYASKHNYAKVYGYEKLRFVYRR